MYIIDNYYDSIVIFLKRITRKEKYNKSKWR